MANCFNSRVEEAQEYVASVTPQEAAALHGRDDVIFVDPRPYTAIKGSTGIIPGAHNVTLEDIEAANLPDVFAVRSLRVITSCQAGPMGAIAANELRKQGFTNVNYVAGGTQGWLDAGYSTVR